MTTAAPKKRKGMSLEDKRITMLGIFHTTVRRVWSVGVGKEALNS